MDKKLEEILMRYQNPIITQNGGPFIKAKGIEVTLDHKETVKEIKQLFKDEIEKLRKGKWHKHDKKDCLITDGLETPYNQALNDLLAQLEDNNE